jgi:ferric-dicitrate binding protein FerR (iron transport regulator)
MPASDIEAEASEWLIRLERDPSPATKAEFEEWIAADARHRAAFVRLEKTWAHADVLRKLRPLDGDVDENVLDKFGQPSSISVTGKDRTPLLAVAASLLWFDRVTLADAVLEFNRYNRRQLVIDDPEIATLHIGGTFDATDLESFVAALQSFGIRTVPPQAEPDQPQSDLIRLVGPEANH